VGKSLAKIFFRAVFPYKKRW